MTETDVNGKLAWTLIGEKLEKFPNSMRSEVTNPNMNIKSSENSFWIVQARHALDPDSLFKTIYLTDNVVFNKYNNKKVNEVKIETTKAIIYPDQEIIETSEFATIITPNSKTTGNGVIADMKKVYDDLIIINLYFIIINFLIIGYFEKKMLDILSS